jgi:hypothetical protein
MKRAIERGRGSGGARAAFWLAWSLAALSLALCGAGVMLYVLTRSVQPPATWGTGGDSAVLIFVLPFLAFPVVGALIASRRPDNPIGWICLTSGIFWMLSISTSAYGLYVIVLRPGSLPFPAAVGSLGDWMWVPALGLLGTFLILLFPDGRLLSPRWRPVAFFCGAVIVLGSVASALAPGPIAELRGAQNPFGLEGYPGVADVLGVTIPLLPLCILISAASLFLRFRRSGRQQRQQIKWIAFAAALVAVGYLLVLVTETLLAPDVAEADQPLWAKLLEDAVTVSYGGIPIAMGFAVLRYRLYDIDLVINRALVYGPLSVTLALVYFGGVASSQLAFRTLSGQQQQPQLAIVISTLAIAALFNPLRRRIQSFIDRRFYRGKYDAAKTLEDFGYRRREDTDLDSLSEDLVGVVRKTMQPEQVSLWLRQPGRTVVSEESRP